MEKQKRVWGAEQKLTSVLTVLKEQASVSELSRQYEVAESLVHKCIIAVKQFQPGMNPGFTISLLCLTGVVEGVIFRT